MRICRVIVHLAFEDLGLLGPLLHDKGYEIRVTEAGIDDLSSLAFDEDDLWIVLGGPIGVYESHDYPFLATELALLRARLHAGLPVLGICLGAQLMAAALGAAVYANPKAKEIGWSALELTEAGRSGPLSALDGIKVLHWHGDIADPPPGARVLASTPLTLNQAFSIGTHGLGLQFHIEVTAPGLERWLIGHRCELGLAGIAIDALRSDNLRYAPVLGTHAVKVVDRWLEELETARLR